ncbi:MAG: hypothetical protein PHU51_03695 [Candidatus Nanoarchaeia archaeon]|nr:hypothetical protein [Candidatus Nanoarchaeia archaeon]
MGDLHIVEQKESYLEKYYNLGFKTGDLILPGLNMEVNLPSNRFFKNLGEVSEINVSSITLLKPLNCQYSLTEDKGLNGKHLGIGDYINQKEVLKASLIMYLSSNPTLTKFLQAHESMHAIRFLGLEEPFMRFAYMQNFHLNPFEKYSSEEDIANYAGLMAVLISDPKNINQVLSSKFIPLFLDLENSKNRVIYK